jgi:putative flippase GtrA
MKRAGRRRMSLTEVALLVDVTILRFGAVGLTTTALDFALFTTLNSFAGFAPLPSNVASYSCGIATSFMMNRFWTFRSKVDGGQIEKHAVRFVVSNLLGLALSSVLVATFVHWMPGPAAKVLSVPIVFMWNYALARLWVFQ